MTTMDSLMNVSMLLATPRYVIIGITMMVVGWLLANYKQPPTWRRRLGIVILSLGSIPLSAFYTAQLSFVAS